MNWTSGVGSALAALALGACATDAPPAQPPQIVTRIRVVDNSCVGVKPIYPACTDVVADTTAKQIADHNNWGAEHCGWKPPTSSCAKAK